VSTFALTWAGLKVNNQTNYHSSFDKDGKELELIKAPGEF
jgi:hypothetical protein